VIQIQHLLPVGTRLRCRHLGREAYGDVELCWRWASKVTALLRLVAIYGYKMRARLSHHHSIGLRVVTLGLVALGLYLIAEDRILAGVVVLLVSTAITWLIGLWVVPWGTETYSRKLSRIMREWIADSRASRSHGQEESQLEIVGMIEKSVSRCIGRTEKLKPSTTWEADHHVLLGALRQYRAALQSYRDVWDGDDSDAVRKARERVLESHRTVDSVSQAFSAKLKNRWAHPANIIHDSPSRI
jgi:hypothetical protein